MKLTLPLFLLVVSNIVFEQTENHKAIPGTKCSLVPPKDFVASTTFSGFQHSKYGASIMVTEMPAPMQSITESFTEAGLKSKGMTLIDKQEIDFNNSKAQLVIISQPANGTLYLKQVLIFGDSQKTILVNGIYPEKNKHIEGEIKKSILSTSFNENQQSNPLDAVAFTIDVKGTDFKLASYMMSSLTYTTDGNIPTEHPLLIVGNSIAKVSTANEKQYCIDRLKKLPRGEQNTVKEINPIQIDNLKGYEIIANGKNKDSKAEIIYQVMLFGDADNYFIIIGMATENFDANLNTFKNIAKTFKRK